MLLKSTVFLLYITFVTFALDCGRNTLTRNLLEARSQTVQIGGVPQPGVWPWMVSGGFRDQDGEWRHICDGVLLLDSVVLTTAACANATQIEQLRMGDANLLDSSDDRFLQIYDIEETVINSTVNVGLWKPSRKVYLNEFVNPICLPFIFNEDQDKYLGEHVTLTTYGATSDEDSNGILKHLPVVMQPKRLCSDKTEQLYCAGLSSGDGSCPGGFGGSPVVQFSGDTHELSDRYSLIGITAAQPAACQSHRVNLIRIEEEQTLSFIRERADKLRGSPINDLVHVAAVFHTLAEKGNVHAIKFQLRLYFRENRDVLHELINHQDAFFGNTALHEAALNGHVDVVKVLIESGSSLYIRNNRQLTPLFVALEANQTEVVELLLRAGSNPNEAVSLIQDVGVAPLQVAATSGFFRIVQLLIEYGANVRSRLTADFSVLHGVMSPQPGVTCSGAMVKYLINRGASIDIRTPKGNRAIHLGAENGQTECIGEILKRGANIEAENGRRRTPLLIATMNGKIETVKMLVERRANIAAKDDTGKTSLHWVAILGNADSVLSLLKSDKGNHLNEKDDESRTALHYAAEGGFLDIVRELVESGWDVNSVDGDNQTPFSLASKRGFSDVMSYLRRNGASTGVINDIGGECVEDKFNATEKRETVSKIDLIKAACGRRTRGAENEWPWMISAGFYNPDGSWQHICGGSLIGHRLVLTAAHCISPISTHVRIGDGDLFSNDEDAHVVKRRILIGLKNRHYRPSTSYFDQAVWILDKPVEFNDNVRPICLPGEPDFDNDKYENKLVSMTGYGKLLSNSTSIEGRLKSVTLKVFGQTFCDRTHSNYNSIELSGRIRRLIPSLFTDNVFCAGYEAGGYGSCNGDSGGPLVQFSSEENKYVQIGIVSGGIGQCGDPNFPGVYVRLENKLALSFIQIMLQDFEEQTSREISKEEVIFHRISAAIEDRNFFLALRLLERCETEFEVDFVPAGSLVRKTLLYLAAELGSLELVRYLLTDRGGNCDFQNVNTKFLAAKHPLHIAMRKNRTDVVSFMIESGKCDLSAVDSYTGENALTEAASTGNLTLIKQIYSKGYVDIDSRNKRKQTAYLIAASNDLNAVKYLAKEGADLEARDSIDASALYYAVLYGKTDIVEYLIDIGTDIYAKRGRKPVFHTAISQNRTEIVKLILNSGYKVDFIDASLGYAAAAALHVAAVKNNVHVAKILVEEYRATVDIVPSIGYGQTPFMVASNEDQYEMMEYLLTKGANINHQTRTGTTALCAAAIYNDVEMVKYLLERGADANIRRNQLGETCLQTLAAFTRNSIEMLDLLVERGNMDVNARNNQGGTPFHSAGASGNVELVEYLLKNGVDIDDADYSNSTILHYAVRGRQNEVIERLVRRGANVEKKNNDGYTPLHTAVVEGYLDTLQVLHVHGHADPNTFSVIKDLSPLHTASLFNYFQIIDYLLDMGANVNAVNELGQSALMVAGFHNQLEAAKSLLKAGANVDLADHEGNTVLMGASQEGQIPMIKLLLEEGNADSNIVAESGDTAMSIAAKHGHLEAVKLLVEHGAKVTK